MPRGLTSWLSRTRPSPSGNHTCDTGQKVWAVHDDYHGQRASRLPAKRAEPTFGCAASALILAEWTPSFCQHLYLAEWLMKGMVQKLVLVITSLDSKQVPNSYTRRHSRGHAGRQGPPPLQVLERWNFDIQTDNETLSTGCGRSPWLPLRVHKI